MLRFLKEYLQEKWTRKVYEPIYQICWKFKRSFQFAKYTFKECDMDFDYTWLLQVMELKLRWMAQSHKEDKWHQNAERYYKQCKFAADLIHRINKGNYNKMYFNITRDVIGKRKWHFEFEQKDNIPLVIPITNGDSQREKDLDFLFSYMRKHITGWWN